jgi:hypothetical protein
MEKNKAEDGSTRTGVERKIMFQNVLERIQNARTPSSGMDRPDQVDKVYLHP